jgi:saccharopine dehydrogenase-like NADP-dependent oxidoreductase
LVCGALPGRLGFELLNDVVKVGRNIVDISYTPRDAVVLNSLAEKNECIVVPQCGVAPGLTNMCVGDAVRILGRKLSSVHIYVGGLPQNPQPPLNYRIVFSLEDVINEYSRPVNVVEKGGRKKAEPLTGRGELHFPGVGKLEYFLTDGLGSLPKSFRNIREMYELTLRYPGHAAIMDTLKNLGFFSQNTINVNGMEIQPRRVALEVLKPLMSLGSPDDLLAFRVIVRNLSKTQFVKYEVLDYCDAKRHVSAMARTTAYPATSVALLVGTGKIRLKGVVPPEKIGLNENWFTYVVTRLRQKGIRLRKLIARRRP